MALRPERRKTNPDRKTISVYIDHGVIRAVDSLVMIGEFPNRSDAIENACRLLILSSIATATEQVEQTVAVA